MVFQHIKINVYLGYRIGVCGSLVNKKNVAFLIIWQKKTYIYFDMLEAYLCVFLRACAASGHDHCHRWSVGVQEG